MRKLLCHFASLLLGYYKRRQILKRERRAWRKWSDTPPSFDSSGLVDAWIRMELSDPNRPKLDPNYVAYRNHIMAEAIAKTPRQERCSRCGNPTSDWVDPDFAHGRICRPCESKYFPQDE